MVKTINQKSKTYSPKPLIAAGEFAGKVDIIIPFHGQYEHCTSLIESILRLTRTNYYCLCIVDDASPNDAYIERVEKNLTRQQTQAVEIKCIRSTEHLGFAGAAKIGYDNTSSPYVVVMHSDCEVEDLNWLRGMGESLLSMKSEGVRMVSAKTDNPLNGSEKQKGNKAEGGFDVILDEDEHLSMYCFMVHRELFQHTDGFIKPYPYGWYEDEEFAYRLKKYGFKQGVSGNSWVHHKGELTMKYVMRKYPESRGIIDGNHDLCVEDMQSLK